MQILQYVIMTIIIYVAYNKFASTPQGKVIIANSKGGFKKLLILIRQGLGVIEKKIDTDVIKNNTPKKDEKVKKVGELETY